MDRHPATSTDARARGTLLGLAWGDALGYPIETWSADLIARVFGRYRDLPSDYPYDRIPGEPRIVGRLRPLGLYSDDTQQALTLIHACMSPGGWQVERWAAHLVEGQARAAWRGTGKFFREAVARLGAGVPPQQAGSQSAGIGAAMRSAPLGAIYRRGGPDDPGRLCDVAFEASCVSHADVRAASMAHAVAACCRMLIEGLPLAEVRRRLPVEVRAAEAAWGERFAGWRRDQAGWQVHRHDVSDALAALLMERHDTIEHLRRAIVARAAPHFGGAGTEEVTANHPFVLVGGVHALCVGLWPEGDPTELLGDLMRVGGDTDTVGAIAGAVLGARFGDAWIPDGRMLDGRRLRRYAECLAGAALPESLDEHLGREAALSAVEQEFRALAAARVGQRNHE